MNARNLNTRTLCRLIICCIGCWAAVFLATGCASREVYRWESLSAKLPMRGMRVVVYDEEEMRPGMLPHGDVIAIRRCDNESLLCGESSFIITYDELVEIIRNEAQYFKEEGSDVVVLCLWLDFIHKNFQLVDFVRTIYKIGVAYDKSQCQMDFVLIVVMPGVRKEGYWKRLDAFNQGR